MRLKKSYWTINTAVEENKLKPEGDSLNESEEFVRRKMRRGDVLAVSMGGNNVLLNRDP